jgi:hypothetical protein
MPRGEKTIELWKNPEYRQAMIEKRKGQKNALGRVWSAESRKKLSLAMKGRPVWNKGLKGVQHHSEATKEKIRDSHKGKNHWWSVKGENHWCWIKDRTKLAKRQKRNDMAYKEWRMSVWLRDRFKCKINNLNCNGRIQAHHILGWKLYPELRYDVNNGITLCQAHHPRKRAEEKRLIPTFRELVSVSK